MKKITSYIVKYRYFFLVLFIILSCFSLYLSGSVKINDDIIEYLPKTSETKIGAHIMSNHFKDNTSSLNVMFKNLTKKEKADTLKKLKRIDGVSKVDYDYNKKYNKGKYTLYKLTVSSAPSSKTAYNVYKSVQDKFDTVGMNGSIYDENKPILPIWIIIIAISGAMVILILLSESYLEPWLYLISIGIAVFINKGTNIMFDSVSSITDSIVAILQLALSMDYSIMLSNRYKQEKENHASKIDAMKEALYQSFKAISSSSVTTIVGLLALAFMSFTIGRDLGFVLAKGVLLSLISIFFCLPALLILCDTAITKTKKKSLNLNLTSLGHFIYKMRYLFSIAIIFLFALAYICKGSITILFTESQKDNVADIFKPDNQIAIVYNNKYEDKVAKYCKELEKNKKIDSVLCYGNTINEKLKAEELNQKFTALGESSNIDDFLVKLIYFHHYNQDNISISLDELIQFINNDIINDDKINKYISTDMSNIDTLSNFTNSTLISKPRSINEIADLLGMSREDASNVLILYNSKKDFVKMSFNNFINFILSDIASDRNYASYLDKDMLDKLKSIQKFTDISKINTKMDAYEIADLFKMDKDQAEKLFMFYRTKLDTTTSLTLNTFANTIIDNNLDVDSDSLDLVKVLSYLSNNNNINTEYDINEIESILSNLGIKIDSTSLNLLYTYYIGSNSTSKLSINDFISLVLSLQASDNFKQYFTEDNINSLTKMNNLLSNYDHNLPNSSLYDIFGISALSEKLNYAITGDIDGTYEMSPYQFINVLLSNDEVVSSMDSNELNNLNMLKNMMDNISTTYNQDEISSLLNIDKSIVNFVFGISDADLGLAKKISLKDLISFMYLNKDNPAFQSTEIDNKLEFAYLVVNNTDTLYNYQEISKMMGIETLQVKQVFNLYDYYHQSTLLTPLEFVNLIIDNKDNELLKNKLSSLNELYLIKQIMESSLNNQLYNVSELSSLLNTDRDTIGLIFSLYNSKYLKLNMDLSLENFIDFLVSSIINDSKYNSSFPLDKQNKLLSVQKIIHDSLNGITYTKEEVYQTLNSLSEINKSVIDLLYMYYGSKFNYDDSWKMTIMEFVNYVDTDILEDDNFQDFLNSTTREEVKSTKDKLDSSKKLLVSDKYSRMVLNTKYGLEDKDTHKFINKLKKDLDKYKDIYVVGSSAMAFEMDKTFDTELNKITLLTMIFIFIVVAVTFKDLLIPTILVLIIQTAVYMTMSFISLRGGNVYFISLLIVQAILMGATIDYAIVYTSYYRESRLVMGVKDAIVNAYNKSIHTIISSSSILIIVTLVVARFADAIAAKICKTISEGALASVILILFILPAVLAVTDKVICRKGYYKK